MGRVGIVWQQSARMWYISNIMRRGFSPAIIIGAVAVLLVLGAGGFFYVQHTPTKLPAESAISPDKDQIVSAGTPAVPETQSEKPAENQGITRAKADATKSKSSSESWISSLFPQSGDNQSQYGGSENRSGWEILTEKERASLPDCKGVLMTVPPVPMESITVIEPIGSSNPPEHTLGSISSDTYIAVQGQGTTAMTPLVAPGDMWIIMINPRYGVTQDPEDHVIKYAFCKDVYGVVDHVKSLSPEMRALVDAHPCPYGYGSSGSNSCPSLLLAPVKAGTPLGTVGRLQGNFNFGTWDLRVTHSFANPARHGFLTKHSTCPFDYFSPALKDALMQKLERTAGGACGSVAYDVPATLAGDWFIGDASPTRPADWGKLLYFGPSSRHQGVSIISISGIIVSVPTKWVFETVSSGNTNRKFDQVVPGAVYCYDNDGSHPYRNYEKGTATGRILVELTSATELEIEYQGGMCRDGTWEFKSPTTYIR